MRLIPRLPKLALFDTTDREVATAFAFFTTIMAVGGGFVAGANEATFAYGFEVTGGVCLCISAVLFFGWHLIRKGVNSIDG